MGEFLDRSDRIKLFLCQSSDFWCAVIYPSTLAVGTRHIAPLGRALELEFFVLVEGIWQNTWTIASVGFMEGLPGDHIRELMIMIAERMILFELPSLAALWPVVRRSSLAGDHNNPGGWLARLLRFLGGLQLQPRSAK
jgi:hypothetical protein